MLKSFHFSPYTSICHTRTLYPPWIPFNPPLLPAQPRLAESCGAPTAVTPLDPSRAHSLRSPPSPGSFANAHWWRLGYPPGDVYDQSQLFHPFSFHDPPFFILSHSQFSTCTSPAQRSTLTEAHTHTSSTPVVARPHARNARMTKKLATARQPRIYHTREISSFCSWSLLASSASSPLEVS
jgi:hypothetical protein